MEKVLRIIGLSVIGLIFVVVIIGATMKTNSGSSDIWDTATIVGNPEAKNHFIIYSDLVCPFCVAFENAIVENEEEFKEYIAENDIVVEIRMTDFLYEYGETRPMSSRYSAEATFCAKNDGKFWDYYNLAITTVWNDYFLGNGKSAVTQMSALSKEYWIEIGKQVGLGESFENCVMNDESLDEVKDVTKRVSIQMSKDANGGGMPYFKFNNFSTSGFDLSWGWDYVKLYFQAGLDS